MTPPPNMSRRNTANFQPWSLCGMSFLAAGNLETSAVETPKRDALTRIVLRRFDAFSQAIFVGLLFEADLDFTCTWSIFLGFSPRFSVRETTYTCELAQFSCEGEILKLPSCLQPVQVPSSARTDIGRNIGVLVVSGNGLCPRSTITISTSRDTKFTTELTDTTIYTSIQISRGPFRDWIPSSRIRRATSWISSGNSAGPGALWFTALRFITLALRLLRV